MDIHRSRFVAYPSLPINTLAFSRPDDKGLTEPKPALKLALGRSNGDIEIWSGDKGNWVQELVFPPVANRSVEALAWIQEPDETDHEGKAIVGQLRLFSIGSTAAVTEWNLATGLPERSSTGNFSEVWCFAAQPRWKVTKDKTQEQLDNEYRGQDLVVGCGDGSLALLGTADNDLVFQRFLTRPASKKARCMSVTWQNRHTVVAGFTDSTIRVFDVRSGTTIRNMSLGAGVPGAPKDSLVWRLKCLPNGNIVSADSNGEVCIWDGTTYYLSQRLVGHDSDCLEIVTSTDGQTILSGGMDGRIAVYKLGPKDGDKKGRWAKIGHRRVHDGDIKAMTVYDSKQLSVVVSGGLDTTPVVTPLRTFGQEHHRKLPGLPHTPVCSSSPTQRLLVTWWDREVSLWRINTPHPDSIVPTPEESRKLVSRIAIMGDDAISSATISDNGSVIAVSTMTSVKAFYLTPTNDPTEGRLKVRKLNLPENFDNMGARLLAISPDARWLSVVAPNSEVHVARLGENTSSTKHVDFLDTAVELERPTRKMTKQSGFRKYERTITRMAFSPDSALLVASDLSGHLDSWVLKGHFDRTAPPTDTAKPAPQASSDDDASSDSDSDSDDEDEDVIFYAQHWANNPSGSSLPKLDSAPLVLSFRPSSTPTSEAPHGNPGVHPTRNNPHAHSHALPTTTSPLFVITSHHQVHEFDVLAGALTSWSRHNPTAVLPDEFQTVKDRVMGLVWDVTTSRARAWLYGSSWVGMLDLSQNHASTSSTEDTVDGEANEAELQTPGRKRKRRESQSGRAMRKALLEARKKSKSVSGAGDRIVNGEGVGAVDEIRRIEDGKVVERNLVAVARNVDDEEDEDDEDAIMDDGAPLKRTEDDEVDGVDGAKNMRRKWWCTYRYRPILGMVPVGQRNMNDKKSLQEAVIVERPLWDLPHLKEIAK